MIADSGSGFKLLNTVRESVILATVENVIPDTVKKKTKEKIRKAGQLSFPAVAGIRKRKAGQLSFPQKRESGNEKGGGDGEDR